ncbi:FecR family protein [Chitinophaga japonensis]|uniref:FecR family protein n=1 Tax=Chitinophaga japonensis TaxID=104662 RepID=UPI001FCEBAEA|nr:FecR domain-containing protein [Chitinophaga japonensis]
MGRTQEHIDWELVYAILAGEADEEQEERWRHLFLSSQACRDLYGELKGSFVAAEEEGEAFARLRAISQLHHPAPVARSRKRYRKRWLLMAGSLAAMLTALLFFIQSRKQPERKAAAWQQIKAAAGRATVITFPEGSTVRLAPLSSIRFPNEFDADKREVILTGEGFFNITKDSARPFLVHTQQLVTKVLGTAFHMQYDSAQQLRVTLVEGKVKILKEEGQDLATLLPCQSFRYNIQEDSWEIRRIPATEAGVLQNGGLIFRAAPLHEVAALLERYFDVKVVFSEPALRALRFSSMFDKPTLNGILTALKASGKIDYFTRDNIIFLQRKK